METLWVSLFWLLIILGWKSYKDNIIKQYGDRITYLERRLERNYIHYDKEIHDKDKSRQLND